MYQIKTVQKEAKTRTGYTVAILSREKKEESSVFAPVRLSDTQVCRSAVQPTETRKSSLKNSFGVFSRTSAGFLVGFFLLNPFLDVYADELPMTIPGESATTEVAEEPPAPVPADVSPAVADESPAPEVETPNVEEKAAEAATSTEDVAPVSPEESEESAPEVVPESVSLTDEIIPTETPASSTPIITETVPDSSSETATTTEIAAEKETNLAEEAEGTASTTEESIESETAESPAEAPAVEKVREVLVERTPLVNVVETKYLFRENECTRLDDGGFYCAPPETASTTVASNDALPRVFVQNDAKNGGSKEIFFEDTNGKKKITDNDFDDDAPSYDKQSSLIVWHSLIKGRYQIMLAGVGTSTARQLTDVSYNNTDPKVRGTSVVWQGWVENNWEIFYIKDVTVEPLVIQQITTNEQPDMFPIISDNFITWQSFFGGSWHVFVYSVENGQISQISRPEAGKYENPRFALLFENRKENGEVETVGYDMITGREIPINTPAKPAPLPQGEKDKTVPVPSNGATASSTAMKNPGKDDDGSDSN